RGPSRVFIRLSLLVVFVAGATTLTQAKQAGSAAKGGSMARDRIERPRARGRDNEPSLYRPVVRALGYDFPELEEVYLSARRQNRGLKFETVIKAYIVAEGRAPESPDEPFRKLVESLRPARNKLSGALEQSFSLTKEAARTAERAAVARYEAAEREAALSRH
ncbi:MAG TPA: hypothetical protein VGV38_13885, partial [Pyrinomonadaceae bacterium]|nr:hypothetical protein [Pyrinomonadaceae bacterium]